jgi:hypothetical protein
LPVEVIVETNPAFCAACMHELQDRQPVDPRQFAELSAVRRLLMHPCMLKLTSLALLASLTGCVVTTTDDPDSSLFVSNDSDFEIHEMYVTEVSSPTWGGNLLGGSILFPGESMELGLDCNTYDAMLIDETGAVCEIQNVDLCFDEADWIITNRSCAVFEALAAKVK